MASEVQIAIAWSMIFAITALLGMSLILLGHLTRKRFVRSCGLVILGLVVFITPVFYSAREVGDEWHPFTPTVADVVLLGTLSFLGGMMTIFGLMDVKEARRVQSRVRGS